MPHITPEIAARAAACFTIVGECHVSDYSTNSAGYAQVGGKGFDGRRMMTTAMRAAFVHWSGEQIPPGMTVDHTCRNGRCVRYAHLRLRTNVSNGRMNGQAGHYDPAWACSHNHPAERRFVRADGTTNCRDCVNESHRKYNQKRRAA